MKPTASPAERRSMSFQPYEIELIQQALSVFRSEELSKCPWEKQPDGQYYYTKNRRVRQIDFIERSIKRQLTDQPLPPAAGDGARG
jgi:hypothetical protein